LEALAEIEEVRSRYSKSRNRCHFPSINNFCFCPHSDALVSFLASLFPTIRSCARGSWTRMPQSAFATRDSDTHIALLYFLGEGWRLD
jgi:hypothetical protein